jgi:lysophospholipid acyltransferase (LPLAT)-like uncharacterized protein
MKPWLTELIARSGYQVVHGLYRTLNVTFLGEERVRPFYERREPFIFAFWHNRLLMMPFLYRGEVRPYVLISQHGDGELIARVCERFGFGTVRGSTTRGGFGALKGCIRLARQGHLLGITPDGPKGPRYVVQPGIIAVAQLTGLPIMPICCGASRYKELASWDRFRIPLPGADFVFTFGEPVSIPRRIEEDELELYRRRVERRLRRLGEETDGLFGF